MGHHGAAAAGLSRDTARHDNLPLGKRQPPIEAAALNTCIRRASEATATAGGATEKRMDAALRRAAATPGRNPRKGRRLLKKQACLTFRICIAFFQVSDRCRKTGVRR
ncbi:hypothetical protein GCM10017653_14040 [Ancylobacter defluvii]|uniref:Uncharacterized protein n=1 Tax=Ancylobacter defluvii TaxID=1282440 RepID=A0A9W6NA88_9HYPH|nr:hypothetical protein GCM10017653_14040 [Ancylobacter defluvii]